ncbi:transglycosylase SLT domain-containing protein [Halomonas elongata]|uniref:MltD family protein n=1 Tax=Halomonas elongata (strain ATCC 33173 / DSM 2581 / NBRC 15536 / NCIMB 2198 / 1H9) TaxID=768066 RepID=E1V3A0_HALED|nr:transglycosylase SLT domain-containing protein [Halomonas elongata]MBW5800600.1 transglycosylase SLT domain-containing protein [Halomonas elongata]RAW07858.1 LysM peptidoglycan-binding domain-containing protein [Halomonas elongata]WBF19875.1 transglycosylase SLT domain-containing protein [Halomonas elongata]WPU48744.1 transglycosylase SLT domain-containing protein [Halomonas elongata DSM 2581]CBV42579.1 MltD family protein [Halomonas elongata DSM 2581]
MTYHTMRRRLFGFASSLSLLGALLATAPYSLDTQAATLPAERTSLGGTTMPNDATRPHARSHPLATFWGALDLQPKDAWERLRASFEWNDQWRADAGHARVQHWIDEYRSNPGNIAEITERARPWLTWIVQQVEARGLPGEIALVPFIESSFDPEARSHFGAAGLWQIMPRTGEALGLRRNNVWDGRLDVVRSTEAALDYIETQADQWYEGDIELSLAAYNAGAGTVNQARRVAQSQGKTGEYWDLSLPSETMDYVPKLLAIAAIIAEPEHYGVELPDIEGGPAFAQVPVTRRVTLDEAARLAGVSEQRLAELNPGLRAKVAHPGQVDELLVPMGHAQRLVAALGNSPMDDANGTTDIHVVQRGDTLSSIASRHAVAAADLARWNGLDQPDALQPGQQLTLSGR